MRPDDRVASAPLPPPPAQGWRRFLAPRWLTTALVVLLAPKCALCVLGYLGLAAGLGLTRPELCGGSASPSIGWTVFGASAIVLVTVGLLSRKGPPADRRKGVSGTDRLVR